MIKHRYNIGDVLEGQVNLFYIQELLIDNSKSANNLIEIEEPAYALMNITTSRKIEKCSESYIDNLISAKILKLYRKIDNDNRENKK